MLQIKLTFFRFEVETLILWQTWTVVISHKV